MEYKIEVAATWEGLKPLLHFADQLDLALNLTPDQSYVLRLVIEESATNIVKYGYEGLPGVIQVCCTCDAKRLEMVIRDQGKPFDPATHPMPDLSANLYNRDVGGLGIFLVRELADQVEYRHDANSGWNELVVVKQAPKEG